MDGSRKQLPCIILKHGSRSGWVRHTAAVETRQLLTTMKREAELVHLVYLLRRRHRYAEGTGVRVAPPRELAVVRVAPPLQRVVLVAPPPLKLAVRVAPPPPQQQAVRAAPPPRRRST